MISQNHDLGTAYVHGIRNIPLTDKILQPLTNFGVTWPHRLCEAAGFKDYLPISFKPE